MGANAYQYDVKLNLSADTKFAKAQIGELQKELQGITQLKLNFSSLDKLTDEINEASNAAMVLQTNLEAALNPKTGNLDLSKFFSQMDKGGNSIENLAESLLKVGPQGSKAFMSLADSISRAEIPLTRTNKLVNGLWDNLKKTAGWQVSSSMIHGLMGGIQQAMGYAQALDKSLTDIRIVTGQSADQMARFAKEANAAAKKLSTTTTDYTNASLIYYQQGLSDAEVKKRSDITIKMANATGTSASKVSDQLTSIWNNFDNGTKSLEHYADVMTALGAATASSTDEIAKGVQKFAAISDTVGLSYEYAASALATITATTRESADTVGNSLKTLFSRIQGLQLGDTLDDGTTLNKYSTALAKVGISIKDSSGALKSMDRLLDEIGSRWNTLAEDQQMALAQTVGGVRQYTQIMTLMENWDFFKENVATAEAATGTLTRQADIYAESWEAAQQRVKASWEGLWDNLIDSDGFKKIANIGSTIIDSISAAISGMGGSGGLLTTLAGTMVTIFKDQLSLGVENVFYNVSALLNPKGAQQKIIDRRTAILQRMTNVLEPDSGYSFLSENQAKISKEVLSRQSAETIDRERHRRMIADENRDVDAQYEEQLRIVRQQRVASATMMDQGQEQFDRVFGDGGSLLAFESGAEKTTKKGLRGWDNLVKDLDGREKALENSISSMASMSQIKSNAEKRNEVFRNFFEKAGLMANQSLSDIDYKAMTEDWANKTKNAEDKITAAFRQFSSGRTDSEKDKNKASQDAIPYTFDSFKDAVDSIAGNTIIGSGQYSENVKNRVTKRLSSLRQELQAQNLIDANGNIVDSKDKDKIISIMRATTDDIFGSIENFNKNLIGGSLQTTGGKKAFMAGYQGLLSSLRNKGTLEEASKREAAIMEERKNLESGTVTNAQTLVSLGTGAISTVGAIQGIEGAIQNFRQGNFGAGLSGMVSAGYNTLIGNRNYIEGVKNLGNIGRQLQLNFNPEKYFESTIAKVNAEKEAYQKNIQEQKDTASKQIEETDKKIKSLESRNDLTNVEKQELATLKQYRQSLQNKYDKLIEDPDIINKFDKRVESLTNLAKNLGDSGAFGKAGEAIGKLGEKLEMLSQNAPKVGKAIQTFQAGYKIAKEVFEWEANRLKSNSEKATETSLQLNQMYENSRNNHTVLLNTIQSYNEINDKLKDVSLTQAQRSEALYEQNKLATELIDKYNITNFVRSEDGQITISQSALRSAANKVSEDSQILQYATNMAEIDAQEARNEYDREQLARKMTGTNFVSGLGTFAASAGVGGLAAYGVGAGLTALASVLPVAALITAGAGLVGAFADDIIRNTTIKNAVEKTKETGSTQWLDEESGLYNQQLKENRQLIQQIADSELATEKLERAYQESTAQDLIKNNVEAQLFEQNQALVGGLVSIQASQSESKKPFITDGEAKRWAEQNAFALGLGDKENLTFEKGDIKGTVKYSYLENNQIQTGYINQQAMAKIKAAEEVKEQSDAYILDSIEIYGQLVDSIQKSGQEAAAAGQIAEDIIEVVGSGDITMIDSELDKDNFFTQAGIDRYLVDLIGTGKDYHSLIAQDENFFNILNRNAEKFGFEDSKVFFENLQQIVQDFNNSNIKTSAEIMAELGEYQTEVDINSLLGGTTNKTKDAFLNTLKEYAGENVNDLGVQAAANTYANVFYTALNEAFTDAAGNLDTESLSKAMNQIMTLDFKEWNIDTSIGNIIGELGGSVANNDALDALIELLRTIGGANVIDIEDSLSQSAATVGKLTDMKIGDTVDKAAFDRLVELGVIGTDELKNYLSVDSDGNYRLIQSTEGLVQDMREAELGKLQNFIQAENKLKGLNENQKNVLLNQNSSWEDVISDQDLKDYLSNFTDKNIDDLINIMNSDYEDMAIMDNISYMKENGLLDSDRTYWEGPDGFVWTSGLYGSPIKVRKIVEAPKRMTQEEYNEAVQQAEAELQKAYEQGQGVVTAAGDFDKEALNESLQKVVSTSDYYEDAMANETVQAAIEQGWYDARQALLHYAAAFPALTAEINEYWDAFNTGEFDEANKILSSLEKKVYAEDYAKKVKELTGIKLTVQEIASTMEGLIKRNDKQDGVFGNYSQNAKILTELATKAEVAAHGYEQLNKYGKKWISTIEKMDDKNKDFSGNTIAAFEDMGVAMSQVLGLWDLDVPGSNDRSTWGQIVSSWVDKEGNDLNKLKSGDKATEMDFREHAVRNLYGEDLYKYYADDQGNLTDLGQSFDKLKNLLIAEDIEGGIDLKTLSNSSVYDKAVELYNKAYLEGGEPLAQATAASLGLDVYLTNGQKGVIPIGNTQGTLEGQVVVAAGNRGNIGYQNKTFAVYRDLVSNADGTSSFKSGIMTTYQKQQKGGSVTQKAQVMSQSAHEAAMKYGGSAYSDAYNRGEYVVTDDVTYNAAQSGLTTGTFQIVTTADGQLAQQVSTGGGGWGGGWGGGGGGPAKVAVKSAQELMTRYKTIDQKRIVAEMQRTVELNKKDLLYGSARIGQLQKINSLLVKQQQLTSDRIEEEMDYLKKDRERIQEVLDRYNEDLKDKIEKGEEEALEIKFNSEGIITNYKQTVGAWAEEIASFYTDGELDGTESQKEKELQKKIDDLNVLIGDYEDSLNQLNTSINEYETMLYEHFNNQAEELKYKVEYKIQLEQDDLSYITFFADVIKDNMGQAVDYIELMGQKTEELYSQLDIYNEGFEEIKKQMDENPLHIYATNGIEDILTADEVETVRGYRDKMTDIYSTLISTRKEVEEKVLAVFDEWHSKINKNVNNINRFTGVLLQFKDIINVVGADVLGLSNNFLKTFEQQTIDQSKDNIEATKKQYESLVTMYQDSQSKLEIARASGDEDSIKHWEEVVDQIETEMNSAQDAMLSALNQTLTLISDQFTAAVTEAVDTFNESIYGLDGLDGLIQDYEQIREQQDYMVEDYEKIYTLSKLNRNIQKTLDDTKIIAGKQKLIEFQEKLNELNKNNVELSRYELDYLQAEYELRLAEIELENSRSSKDSVRLSRDSEGNWSYIYTQNEAAVDAAEQRYEDALFNMQQMNRSYTEEMSLSILTYAQQMRDEMAALELNKNNMSPEAYKKRLEEIQTQYADFIANNENELNKSIQNSANLYDKYWTDYNKATGYGISETSDWIDSFGESTLGTLLGSNSVLSNFAGIITSVTDTMVNDLYAAAVTYFENSDKALQSYGSSLSEFSSTVQNTTDSISSQSKDASQNVSNMASDMVNAFEKVAQVTSDWQETFGADIKALVDSIGEQIKTINDLIQQTEELGNKNNSDSSLIGQEEASELLNKETFHNKDLFGTWSFDEETGVTRHTYTNTSNESQEDIEQNLVEFNGELINKINEIYRKWVETTDPSEKSALKDELKLLLSDYAKFKNILMRIYDITDITLPDLDEEDAEELATGGYTGEWGSSGKLAVLHEKELVLSKDDTANFLNALAISKQLVEMIEMNARQSSLGLGEMHASTIHDTTQTIEQQVSITAEFPNATDHSEIEEAFDNLINMASQYAYRS